MIFYRYYRSEKVTGMHYEMQAGDSIPMHTHVADTAHNIIVLRGAVQVHGEIPDVVLRAGDVLDFDSSKKHQIDAISDNTEILNLFINGEPENYDRLPAGVRTAFGE